VDKRYEGLIIWWNDKQCYGFIDWDKSKAGIFVHRSNVIRDWKASRAWCRIPGTPVTFSVAPGHTNKEWAVDVKPVFAEDAEDLHSYCEVSCVDSVRDGRDGEPWSAWIKRADGDDLFFNRSDINGEYSHLPFPRIGEYVWHQIKLTDTGAVARNIKIYSTEEQNALQRQAAGLEVEVPFVEPASILAPETRSVPLIELIRRRNSNVMLPR
jgi:cold shock CspA family protein